MWSSPGSAPAPCCPPPPRGHPAADGTRITQSGGGQNRIDSFGLYDERAMYTPGFARRDNQADRQYLPDWRGSTRYVTDSAGAVRGEGRYDAYGQQMAGSALGTPHQFAGGWGYEREENGALGLDYLYQRYYDPAAGRFISRDPIGWAGGLNLYGYCGNDPVNAVDPSGLDGRRVDSLDYLNDFAGGIASGAAFGTLGSDPTVNRGSNTFAAGYWFGAPGSAATFAMSGLRLGITAVQRAIPAVGGWWMQRLTTAANNRLAADPALAQSVLSPRSYAAAQTSCPIARMQYGHTVERLVARQIRSSRMSRLLFEYKAGPNNPDFVGRGIFAGLRFDITTPAQVQNHLERPYGSGLITPTYTRSADFKLFP